MQIDNSHIAVLLNEAITGLAIKPDGVYIDCTFGRGGHSSHILSHLSKKGRLIAIDRDLTAIAAAEKFADDDRFLIEHSGFSNLAAIAEKHNLTEKIDGILLDLGVSSPQLDNADRGFSFMNDGPLDMRMNPETGQSAEQWINSAGEAEIADVLYQYGEERHSRRMARRVILERTEKRITRTAELAEIIKEANPAWERDKHPATRAFQGIRIFINDELGELERGLEQALKMLKVGGRLVVISFHSLEDRMVKRFIAKQAKGDNYPRGLPIPQDMLSPKLNPIGKRIKASALEVDRNSRSRSAVMRVAQKIA